MLRNVGFGVLTVVFVVSSSQAETVRVKGRVVDQEGKAVEGAEVGTCWIADFGGPMKALAGTETDAQGRFALECDPGNGELTLMAIARGAAAGGATVVGSESGGKQVVVRVGPLVEVHGHFTCRGSGNPPSGTNVYFSLKPGKNRLVVHRSRGAEFDLRLPPGDYELIGHGSLADYEVVRKPVTLEGKVHDLGAIDLEQTALARHYGKELPPWHVTDARGLPQGKDVALSDFKGKWVVLDFWGYWCHACVGFSLPSWAQFAAEHDADRDRFIILAFHDPRAKSFADLDKMLAPVIQSTWQGKPMTLPILLDSTGTTVERLGVRHFPTVLLIDPEGHLVKTEGVEVETYLAGKLTPVPNDRRIAHALERNIPLSTEEGMTLERLVGILSSLTRQKIEFDEEELKAAGISKEIQVPRHTGSLNLRGWLDLALEPHNLTFVPGDGSLKIVRKTRS